MVYRVIPQQHIAALSSWCALLFERCRGIQRSTDSHLARLTNDAKKKDARRIYLRSTLERREDGSVQVRPAKSQSSGLFSPFQSGNCLAVLPEGVPENKKVEAGTLVECLLLDVDEGVVI